MKKIYSFALMLLVLISGVLLSACKTNFDNLSMSFISLSGTNIDSVELNIEKTNDELNNDTLRLGVKFDGISEQDIGNVVVQSKPSGLVTVSNYVYQNNVVYFTIKANNPSLSGKLEVLHLASNKTASVNLVIGQKSSDLNLTSMRYIVAIPETGEKETSINVADLISLYPKASTDEIYFKLAGSSALPGNVSFQTKIVDDENLIIGFKLNSDVEDGKIVKLYPVTYMKNYPITSYESQVIEFVFKKVLTDDEIVLASDNLHNEYLLAGEPIYLIENDSTIVETEGSNYSYNNVKISLKQKIGEEEFALDDYMEFYQCDLYSSNENIKAIQTNEGIVIQANEFTNSVEEVEISLVPKDCVGEISTITKRIRVKGEVKPEDITVYMQGEVVDTNESLQIFDQYVSSSNSLGAQFNFTPIETYSKNDFKSMRIYILPEILNAYILSSDGLVGINPIYDKTFTTQITNTDIINNEQHKIRNNRYVLDIYVGNRPLKFYYDEASGKMVSEIIAENQSLFIKYTETNITSENYGLTLDVKCEYLGNLTYLSNILLASKTLIFNRASGVTNLKVNAGELLVENNSTVINTIKQADGSELVATTLYLNRLNGTNNLETYSNILFVGDSGVLGVNNKEIAEATFNIKILSGAENPLKIKQYNLDSDGNGKAVQGFNEITYNYTKSGSSSSAVNNAILLLFDNITDIGEYTIQISHANGYVLNIKCFVYQDLTENDIAYTIDENSTAFKNKTVDGEGNATYLFDGYTADYIVASGQSLDFELLLDEIFTSADFVTSYEITEGVSAVGDINISDYFKIIAADNRAVINFLRGSNINGEDIYFTLNAKVVVKKYDNILVPNGTREVPLTLSFFIYDEIKAEDVSISATNVNLYIYEQLGAYYKDEADAIISVNLNNTNLWNYVQGYKPNYEDGDFGTSDKSRVVWSSLDTINEDNATGYNQNITILEQTDNSLKIRAHESQSMGEYQCVIVAKIKQFNTEFAFIVKVNVKEPNITERVEITSAVSMHNDDRENPYINLRAGESYKVTVNNFSNYGVVTNSDILLVVADKFGNSNYNSVVVDNANQTINVRKAIEATNNLQLIIFARDALNEIISSNTQGFNDPQSFIIDGEGSKYYIYKNAYCVIDLILSDGTENNPYLIENGDDFWKINNNVEAHYKLMNNVDISNTNYTETRVIEDFSGSITTDSYIYGEGTPYEEVRVFSYSLYGIVLNENTPNLFVNVRDTANIKNVNFSVYYNYNITSNKETSKNNDIYLGLIGVNNGNLENVSVTANGSATFGSANGTTSLTDNFYFGALVGKNNGSIIYKTSSVVGANVNIFLSGDANISFGGLVGLNLGKVEGYSEETATNEVISQATMLANETESNVVFSVLIAGEGAIANVNITSQLTNDDSTIGGVIGTNGVGKTKLGTLKKAFVTGKISATNSNIGGVIGTQNSANIISTIQLDSLYKKIELITTNLSPLVENVKSNVQVEGKNNVGGVVGNDKGGYYKNVHYQILEHDKAYLIGINNIGGIAGSSTNGYFDTCSVMSYRWNYNDLTNTFIDEYDESTNTYTYKHADIIGENYVGGIIGYAVNEFNGTINEGVNENVKASIVVFSSVSAYLESKNGEELGDIGGILTLDNDATQGGKAFVFNASFIGKLDGDIYYYSLLDGNIDTAIALANNNNYLFNICFSVNVDVSNDIVKRSFKDNGVLEIENIPTNDVSNLSEGWGYSADLNGGYIFISKLDEDGNSLNTPIYELAPTDLMAKIKDNLLVETGRTTLLHLDYYSFNLDVTSEDYVSTFNRLNDEYNTKILKDLFDFEYAPTILSEVRIYAESGNADIISISNDKLRINGVGQTTLTFRTVLNPQVCASILVDVSLPVGTNVMLSDGEKEVNGEQNIALNRAKQYYIETNGVLEGYSYQVNEDIHLKVDITSNVKSGVTIVNTNPYTYISISGINPTNVDGNDVVIVPSDTPLYVSVIKYVKDISFEISITPFTIINYKGEKIRKNVVNNPIKFTLNPAFGATNISLDFNSAIMYPNDTTIITAYIETDIELEDSDIESFVKSVQINGELQTLSDYIEYLKDRIPAGQENNYNEDTKIQTAYFRLKLKELNVSNLNSALELVVRFGLDNGMSASANFTVLPQRINKIEINNYVYINREAGENVEIEESSVLRPKGAGLLIINIAPNNGYYDYLEISDITGDEEIVFSQVSGIAGERVDMNLPSSDDKGIRLIKQDGTIYVETRISSKYSSKNHTISVRAYLQDGRLLCENFIVLDVRMLPEIELDYIDPNGVNVVSNYSDNFGHDYYLALGTNAEFRVKTSNSDGNVEVNLSIDDGINVNEYFEFVQDYGEFYILRSKAYDENLLGKTLTITVSTTSTQENGNFETASTKIDLKIVNFVVHNVSVTSSRVDYTTNPPTRTIYGDYGTDVDIEFYFRPTDISFYDNSLHGDKYWNTTYGYDENLTTDNASLVAINNILGELNTNFKDYHNLLNQSQKDQDGLDIIGNKLTVISGNKSTILSVAFTLVLNGNDWEIEPKSSDIANTRIISNELDYIQDYSLDFVTSNSYEDPIVITSKSDFLNMSSSENSYYSLACDLTLENYTPLDVNVRMFDGNGHTITIQSFAMFDEAEIKAGLFKEVSENMIVANLNVIYSGSALGRVSNGVNSFVVNSYADLCQNPDVNYTSAVFGGITPTNNGIITNCKVSGTIALSASVIESKKQSTSTNRYTIDFNIGGLVGVNSSTGYITNSTSSLYMFAQANIGGLIYSNAGKIVSSEFNGLIYAYNNNVENTIISSVAGFVVNNTGNISMSNVKIGQTELNATNYIGNLSAKDISAGFVYNNSGTIEDAYVNLVRIGANNNTFSGFVNTNSGTINRTYSFINNGIKSSSVVNMFAPQNTAGIENSIEIVYVTGGYSSKIENLLTVEMEDRFTVSKYKELGFTFGDNENAIWSQTSLGVLPSLVVEGEQVGKAHNYAVGDEVDITVDGVAKSCVIYDASGLRAVAKLEETVVDSSGHTTIVTTYKVLNDGYGKKSNPYLIYDIESWNNYFKDYTTSYFRLITDIDFSSIYDNPSTSNKTFSGNLQGNNMRISGLTIYSSSVLEAIGLFKELKGASDISIDNAIRNITISANSVLASKTTAVGILSGITENFNLYNIKVDSAGLIVVGKNAVGGLTGILRGEFDVETISSNVGANSTRSTTNSNYSIYMSKNNNKTISNNINNVYYAGGLIGIVDAYNVAGFNINEDRDIELNTYCEIRNAEIRGNVTVLGDIVGGMFGFVGERVKLDGAHVSISGTISGKQYSAGAVGENRGVLTNVLVESESDELFNTSTYVAGGIVGLNLGGIVMNSNASVNAIITNSNATVGGVIGRNINGYVTNVYVDASLQAMFTGGIIGANYSRNVFIQKITGSGSINSDCVLAVPQKFEYKSNSSPISNLSNLNITRGTIDYLFENMAVFYSYKSGEENIEKALARYRVYGLIIGVESDDVTFDSYSYSYLVENEKLTQLIINNDENNIFVNSAKVEQSIVGTILNAKLYNGAVKTSAVETTETEPRKDAVGYDIPYTNIIKSNFDCPYITYIVGAKLSSFENWDRKSYGDTTLVFTSNSTEIFTLSLQFKEGDNTIVIDFNIVSGDLNYSNNTFTYYLSTNQSYNQIEMNAEYVQNYFEGMPEVYLNNSKEEDDFDLSQSACEFKEVEGVNQATVKFQSEELSYTYVFIVK